MTRTYRRDGPRRPSPRAWIPTLRAAWVGKRFVANECQHVSRGLEARGRRGVARVSGRVAPSGAHSELLDDALALSAHHAVLVGRRLARVLRGEEDDGSGPGSDVRRGGGDWTTFAPGRWGFSSCRSSRRTVSEVEMEHAASPAPPSAASCASCLSHHGVVSLIACVERAARCGRV